MDQELLRAFDVRITSAGYTNRSAALRDIIRDYLVEREWDRATGEVVGTVTLVYDHHSRELESRLIELQHSRHDAVVCSTHVHLDAHHCLEVIVLRGSAEEVRSMGERLIGTRGVKHGKLTCTTTGRGLA